MEIPLWIARHSRWNLHVGATFVIRESRLVNRFTIHDVTSLILFTLVFFLRHDAIVNRVRMKHYRDQVEEKESCAKSRSCDLGQKYENPSGNRTIHPQA